MEDTFADVLAEELELSLKYKYVPPLTTNKAMIESIIGIVNPFCLFFILVLTIKLGFYYVCSLYTIYVALGLTAHCNSNVVDL